MIHDEFTTPSAPPAPDIRPDRRLVTAIAIAVATAAVPAIIGDTVISVIARSAGGISGNFLPVLPAAYITMTIIGLTAGALGWITITRVSAAPSQILRRLVPAVVVLSFIPDIALGISHVETHTTWGGVTALMAMHVVVATAGVASYHRFLPSRP